MGLAKNPVAMRPQNNRDSHDGAGAVSNANTLGSQGGGCKPGRPVVTNIRD
jgi:hypothetical protein